MQRTFTRQELYELVWTEPMRALGERFGMSDNGLAKYCKASNIPRPPRGYWAKLAAGKKVTRLALPERTLGMSDTIEIGGKSYSWHSRHKDFLKLVIPPPPEFGKPLELVREEVERAVGKVTVPQLEKRAHRSVSALLRADDARREKLNSGEYVFSWDKPHFDSIFERRRLRLINALFLGAARLGCKANIGGKTAGHLSIEVGDTRVSFEIDEIKPRKKDNRWSDDRQPVDGRGGPIDLKINDWHVDEGTRLIWKDESDHKIEKDLAEILTSIIVIGEMKYRNRCFEHHAWLIKMKAEAEEEERQRVLEAERKERERLERLAQARIDKLLGEAADFERAETIRKYVARVRRLTQSEGVDEADGDIEAWAEWALGEADRIDPVLSERFREPLAAPEE